MRATIRGLYQEVKGTIGMSGSMAWNSGRVRLIGNLIGTV